MLKIENLTVSYGLHTALQGVSLHINPGEIVAILGANGAGKSSLLSAIAGISEGKVEGARLLNGDALDTLPSEKIVDAGIALVPEGRGIFGDLSVWENLLLGAYSPRARGVKEANLEKVLDLFPKLADRKTQIARTMSGGEQQMVAIGRAMMSNPDVLMLDEPSLGLSPLLSQELFANLARIRDAGVTVLLVEQNAKQALAIADRGYLIENGQITGENTAAALLKDPAVQAAYLGGGGSAANGKITEDTTMGLGHFIENTNVASDSGETFERMNPVTGEVASTAAEGTAADVDHAVQSSAEAFKTWSQMGPNARRKILNACADALDAKTPDFIALGAAETGGAAPWIGFNCMLAANMLREAASLTTQIKGEIIPADKPGTMSMGYRQPVGVLVGMAPWNAPVILAVRSFATAIACGNTVVMKASEKCPALHRLIGDAMAEGGLPPGVLNIVSHSAANAPEVVNALIDHPLTRRINFTGSTRVGQIIAERAAKHLKPCLLELGGKAPQIVLDDADLEGAVNAAIFGAFMNQGQICMSAEKIIVTPAIADAFTQRFTERAEALVTGPPTEQVHIASVVDRDTIDHVAELIDDAVVNGATVLTGGAPTEGTIMPATIVDKVSPDMKIYASESFGPVTTIIRAADEAAAIRIANDTEYGLTASAFTQDTRRGLEIAKQIKSGICHINGPTVGDEAQMPFGGTKRSGYGRFGGTAGIAEFTELRWITIEDPNQHYPI